MAHHGPVSYVVVVSDYPREIIEPIPEIERYVAHIDWITHLLGGKLSLDRTIEQNGIQGHEYEFQIEDKGVIRTTLFWSGNRQYCVNVTFKPELYNDQAAEYFLNSFKLTDAVQDTAP